MRRTPIGARPRQKRPAARRAFLSAASSLCVALMLLARVAPVEGADSRPGVAPLSSGAGCIAQPDSRSGERACTTGHGLLGASGLGVSPDGRHLYVAATDSSAVTTLVRHATTGGLVQGSCVSNDGSDGRDGTDGRCSDGKALARPTAVALSPDGRHLYAAASASSALALFERDVGSGELRQVGCISNRGGRCADGTAMRGARAVVVSPDGLNVYVAAPASDAVVAFSRDPVTGELSPAGCVSDDGADGACADGAALKGVMDVAVSGDGRNLYAAAARSDAVATFERLAGGRLRQTGCVLEDAPKRGRCGRARGLRSPSAVAVSPDGASVYVTALASNAVTVFARAPSRGDLVVRGCAAEAGGARCARASELSSPSDVVVAGGGTVFVSAAESSALMAFGRTSRTSGLAPIACFADLRAARGCRRTAGLAGASAVALSPDGANVYVAGRRANAVAAFSTSSGGR